MSDLGAVSPGVPAKSSRELEFVDLEQLLSCWRFVNLRRFWHGDRRKRFLDQCFPPPSESDLELFHLESQKTPELELFPCHCHCIVDFTVLQQEVPGPLWNASSPSGVTDQRKEKLVSQLVETDYLEWWCCHFGT